MSTATLPAGTAKPARATFGDTLFAEWTKLVTVRSTFWTLLAGIVISIGISAAVAAAVTAGYSELGDSEKASFDATGFGLAGLSLGILAFAVLGVLVITSEYSSGMIRTSLAAMPRRVDLLAAKALVLFGVVLVVGEIVSFGSFFLSQLIFSGKDLEATLTEPGVFRAVVGGGLVLAVTALLGLGVGTLLRNVAGSVTVILGVLFVAPIIGGFLPGSAGETINKFLPSSVSGTITTVVPPDDGLSPWTGFALYTLYALILLALATFRLKKSDA
ncbi:ABC transporter permease subunit [Actinocorallia lasiicapitis]